MEALAHELEAGQTALDQARWEAARRCFEAVLASGESAQARDGLGLALWVLGEVAAGIESKACAFELYSRGSLRDEAARTAVWVSHQHFVGGRVSAARGWLARAERVLQDVAECEGHGWVAVERARHASGVEERVAHAQRAVAIARRFHSGDLETFALSLVGRARVEGGHTEDGLCLLEEALAGAVGEQVRNIHTLAEAYCNLIIASTSTGDWARATEWCELVDTFARAHHTAPLWGTCRGVHADVLLATGHWAEAEQALESALAIHARNVPEMAGPSVASLAELRVCQGRLEEAEALLAGREENPAALRALALLRLAQGRPGSAVFLLERGVRHDPVGVVATSRLLDALVDARLALADVDGAERTANDLADLGVSSGVSLVTPRAELSAARVASARGHPEEAVRRAQGALTSFLEMAMPFDAARARLELARALATAAGDGSLDLAREEALAALGVFRQLGATRPAEAAAALLHEMGAVRNLRPAHRPGPLTPREQEVLELIAQGLSNARIAASLVITEKTAGHHVSHILTKLGVHNRTEAATHVGDQN